MLALERRNTILEKLLEEKKVVVSELSLLFSVSEETIRRDLEKLHNDGLCTKSYGGAVVNENYNTDLPFNIRKRSNVEAKQVIAKLVAQLVEDGEHIMLDASSTAVFISKALKQKERLTIVTNSLEILFELSDVSGWNIFSVGGQLKEGYLALFGPRTVENIKEYNVEKVILSAKAFDPEKGFSDSVEEFAKAKQAMMDCGKQIIFAIDSSKIGKFAFSKFANLQDVDMIVTDEKPSDEVLAILASEKVKCLYP